MTREISAPILATGTGARADRTRRAAPGQSFFPLQDDIVHYAGQPVALVIADSLERAQHAASLVRVEYETAPAVTTIEQGRDRAYEPERLIPATVESAF